MRAGTEGCAAQTAVAWLCETYHPALVAYAQAMGLNQHQADDVVQDLFTGMLSRNDFAQVDPGRGSFRQWLKQALRHQVAKHFRRADAGCRDRGKEASGDSISLIAPEVWYGGDRAWALTVLHQARMRLRQECSGTNARILAALGEDLAGAPCGAIAVQLDVGESVVKVAALRLRRRFGELVREVIQETLADPDDQRALDDELAGLMEALRVTDCTGPVIGG